MTHLTASKQLMSIFSKHIQIFVTNMRPRSTRKWKYKRKIPWVDKTYYMSYMIILHVPRYIFIRKIFTQRSSHLLANVAYLYLFCEIRSLVDKQEVRTLHACGTYSVTSVPGPWEETELPPISSRKRLKWILNHNRNVLRNCWNQPFVYFLRLDSFTDTGVNLGHCHKTALRFLSSDDIFIRDLITAICRRYFPHNNKPTRL